MSIEVIIIAVMAVVIVVLITILAVALAKGTQEMERLEALPPHELTPEDLHKLAVAAQDHKVKEYYRRLAADRARFFRAVRDIGKL
ncbi:hypothetical protein [Corynebacterium cystitidis]|uniref:hypothetical protein n=1 Tax=Corynebacterium cystitidis TaxID=35757 RepID=UPI00211F08C5|nr:hypothetical protein [Corynebacterium cystitidis]